MIQKITYYFDKILLVYFSLVVLFQIFFTILELINIDDFRFGYTMVTKGGWVYLSAVHYFGSGVVHLALAAIGVAAGFLVPRLWPRLGLRLGIVAVFALIWASVEWSPVTMRAFGYDIPEGIYRFEE